ncbi:VOC family protein [Pantoea agglomerans]|jgi:catechol 2,3-dioxygenase-like lactoylglutathione lyase family enzyme|uniref:VOC family protein n=1 Tax=Enterobacter agglomerans TaxID=549 RepID=UPI0016547580|nr:VOC family protein [Pantoea agglomerans]
MIQDFFHLSITTRDLERSIQFYETLGLEVTQRFGDVTEKGIATAFCLPASHLKVVYLAPPGGKSGIFIDLVEWVEPSSPGAAYPVAHHIGINRFALRVSDLDATVLCLQEKGMVFLTKEAEPFGGGIRCIVITDPDGIFIQLIELP